MAASVPSGLNQRIGNGDIQPEPLAESRVANIGAVQPAKSAPRNLPFFINSAQAGPMDRIMGHSGLYKECTQRQLATNELTCRVCPFGSVMTAAANCLTADSIGEPTASR